MIIDRIADVYCEFGKHGLMVKAWKIHEGDAVWLYYEMKKAFKDNYLSKQFFRESAYSLIDFMRDVREGEVRMFGKPLRLVSGH